MAEKKINGKTFKVDTPLAMDAIKLKLRLLKAVGAGVDRLPEIMAGAGGKVSKDAKRKSDAAAVAAFTEIFTKGDPDDMANLIKDIAQMSMIKRASGSYEQVDVDGDFSGDLGTMFAVIVFVLQETFGDFFTALAGNGTLRKLTGA